MRVEALELRVVELPMATPFATAHGAAAVRRLLLVRARTDVGDGWGECGAEAAPTYAPEWVDGAVAVVRAHLGPRVLAGQPLDAIRGHPMAKAALQGATLDAELRASGASLAAWLGVVRPTIPAGVAVGVLGDVDALVAQVAGFVAQGYRRVKLKVQPGWDVAPVRAVREAVGPDVVLAADANGSYGRDDLDRLRALDPFGLQLLEQPFAPDDLVASAEAVRRLATPVALDESIGSLADLEVALALGACQVLVLKPGRVGGVQRAAALVERCRAVGVPVAVGGMLESGVGRAVAVALAAMDGVDLTGDLSASDRWWDADLTDPLALGPGATLAVRTEPGASPWPDPDRLAAATVHVEELRLP